MPPYMWPVTKPARKKAISIRVDDVLYKKACDRARKRKITLTAYVSGLIETAK